MKLKKVMEEKNIDGILLTDLINIRYFTGFTGTTGTGLVTKKGRYFFADFRYTAQASEEVVPKGFEVVKLEGSLIELIKEYCEKDEVKKIGLEDRSMTLSQYNNYKGKLEGFEFEMLGDHFTTVRMVKEKDELDRIREAARIADEAFAKIRPLIKVGAVEKDLKTELEYEMKKLGADGPSFDIIVASNYRSALPHGVASEKKIEKEGFLTFDFGCFYKGYASDITRTLYVGEAPSEKHLEIYNLVLEAQIKAAEAVAPGVSVRELDKIARDHIEAGGYGDKFGHGLGHGIGLVIHEYPGVSGKAKEVILEPGMVITIEPGIYIDGFGGVRIEDDVVVTETGGEILNKTSKEFTMIK